MYRHTDGTTPCESKRFFSATRLSNPKSLLKRKNRHFLEVNGIIIKLYLLVLFLHGELLLLDHFELVSEVELCGFLLQFGEFVFIFGHLLEGGLNTEKLIMKPLVV